VELLFQVRDGQALAIGSEIPQIMFWDVGLVSKGLEPAMASHFEETEILRAPP